MQEPKQSALKAPVIPTRFGDQLVKALMPSLMHALAKEQILRPEHLESTAKLTKILRQNLTRGIKKMESSTAIEDDFIKAAIINWKKGKKFVAIVLYAVAVEQYVNQTYCLMLKAHGLDNREVEQIVRNNNIEPKTSWLLRLLTKKKFPKALGKRLRSIFELRNAIVHFKGIPGPLDEEMDSYSKVKVELGKLKRLSISRDYRLLQEYLWNVALEKDPNLDLAQKAAAMYFARHKKK